jgi:hypothetical protein
MMQIHWSGDEAVAVDVPLKPGDFSSRLLTCETSGVQQADIFERLRFHWVQKSSRNIMGLIPIPFDRTRFFDHAFFGEALLEKKPGGS